MGAESRLAPDQLAALTRGDVVVIESAVDGGKIRHSSGTVVRVEGLHLVVACGGSKVQRFSCFDGVSTDEMQPAELVNAPQPTDLYLTDQEWRVLRVAARRRDWERSVGLTDSRDPSVFTSGTPSAHEPARTRRAIFVGWHRTEALWREIYARTASGLLVVTVIYVLAALSGFITRTPLYVLAVLILVVISFGQLLASVRELRRVRNGPPEQRRRARLMVRLFAVAAVMGTAATVLLLVSVAAGRR